MSQPAPNPHTQRSVAGMVGSMIVVVIVVVGWVGFRSLTSDPPSPPPRVVDWTAPVRIGDAADALAVYAPAALPAGWSAKDARYSSSEIPRWELALRTDNTKTVSITETFGASGAVVSGIDDEAVQGDDVTINGAAWKSWKFSGGDYGVSLSSKAPDGTPETVLVHGSGSRQQIEDFAASLKPTNT